MVWRVSLATVDFTEEELIAVEKIIRSKWVSMGPITAKFEARFKEYIGSNHAIAVSSGTAALHLALRAIGVREGDEVIIPSLTFVATANSVLYCNAKPIFAEITSLDDWNISPESIKEKITRKTKAIVTVHYAGYPCDMKSIMEIAEDYKLKVVEDAAHAIGAEIENKKCGTIGDVGCFSFFANKNITTAEGGMVVTDDEKIANKIKLLRSHGMTTLTWDRERGYAFSYDVMEIGYNYRLNEISSAIGIEQLKKLDKNNSKRERIVKQYRKKLKDLDNLYLPFSNHSGKPSYHLMPVLLDNLNREAFMKEMQNKGIQTSIHYPPIHLFKIYKEKFGYQKGYLPLTEYIGENEVTLPLHPLMGAAEVDYVVDSIQMILES
jgi:dTDP-4-amino-4,6-dideoxygalactose transaminase